MVCDIIVNGEDQGWRKGPWTPQEDELLSQYVKLHGEGRWTSVATNSGLNRTGKSCRLRWVNYLRPGLKRGHLSPQEEAFVIELHALWGNKWSTIARYLPGRTDNEIKNFWRTHFKKREKTTQKQRKKQRTQILKQLHQQDDSVLSTKTASSEETNEKRLYGDGGGEGEGTVVFSTESSSTAMEDQILSMMYEEFAVWADEDSLWGGLWNYQQERDYEANSDSRVSENNSFLWEG